MSSKLPSEPNNRKNVKPEPFGELIKSMNDFFNEKPIKGFLQSIDEFFKSPFPSGTFHVETRDSGGEYIISAELPGIKRDQIQLNIVKNYLTISVESSGLETGEDSKGQIFQRRYSRQQLSRTISLPQPIMEEKVNASYRDGLLQIRIPQEKGRMIQIEE